VVVCLIEGVKKIPQFGTERRLMSQSRSRYYETLSPIRRVGFYSTMEMDARSPPKGVVQTPVSSLPMT